jgi:hypothetical protein
MDHPTVASDSALDLDLSVADLAQTTTKVTSAKPVVVRKPVDPKVSPTSGFFVADMNDMDPDAALAANPRKKFGWKDPVNQRVLGDPKWMAKPSREMQERITKAMERHAPEPDPRIKPMERRLAVEAIRPIVDRCFTQAQANVPGLVGRAIVIFEASSNGKTGVIKNVRFGAVVKLDEDPGFRDCVILNAEGLGFDTTEPGEARTVEYPFFYDQ